ncbi:MAG: GTPase Era [Bdellovibrionales bacterium]|nr:GTPase Era [Bdellovibrionales bacterium]
MNYKAGFVGLIGLPNAGKSTLANTLIGEKVSIVTAKPQTTRQRVLGIRTDESSQILFLDAPGVIKSTSGLNGFLGAEYQSVMADSDVLIAVLNIDFPRIEDLIAIAETCSTRGKPWMAVITKTDFEKPQRAAILREKLQKFSVPTVAVSALHQKEAARELVLPLVKDLLPLSLNQLVDPEIYTSQTLREMVSEIVREKAFELLHQEIPYGLAVQILKFDEDSGPVIKIYANILVNKDGHKAIVVGAGGSQLKQIGQTARREIEVLTERQVYLDLHVVVKKNWAKNSMMLEELGYVVARK